jgi:hypothetical protein
MSVFCQLRADLAVLADDGDEDIDRDGDLPLGFDRDPLQLLVAYQRARIGNVVQRVEMHARVVEGVVGLTEELPVGLVPAERSVVLAGHEADVLDLELADDFLELRKTL